MNTKILLKLGFIENEAKVYLELLKKGPSSASGLAETTKLHRTHTYDILRGLIKKGAVSYMIKENRKYFQANPPETLFKFLKERKEELQRDKKELSTYVNELKNIEQSVQKKLTATIYQGKEGIKTILNNILEKKEDYLVIGYAKKSKELLPYYLPNFHKQRIKLGIKRKILMNYDKKGKEDSKIKLQEIKYLPKEYSSQIGQLIYSNKVVIIITQEDDFVAMVIEDEEVSKSFKKQFEALWKLAKP